MAVQQQEGFRCNWMGSGLKCAQVVSVQVQQMWLVRSCWDWDQQELCTQMGGKYCKGTYLLWLSMFQSMCILTVIIISNCWLL